MKLILVTFLAALGLVAAAPSGDVKVGHAPYPRFIQIPDDEGNLRDVDLGAEPDHALLDEITKKASNNVYLLYTRRNPENPQTLVMNDVNSIRSSNFYSDLPTMVIAHGWLCSRNCSLNSAIRDAYLGTIDANIIVVEWSGLAMSDYVTVARGVPTVGRGLGQFLNFLHRTTLTPFSWMHLVGFGLGAHVVGNAGRELGGRVSRVTGLDPAGPLFVNNTNRINKHDARYVEGIHTEGYLGLGISSAIGDADFFPNGGNGQPGCRTVVCDHDRAWQLFAASINHDHLVGRRCDRDSQLATNSCVGPELKLGNGELKKWGTGIYRVNTGREYPY